ncbi:MAG: MFS transporter, partial [Sphingobium sp.]
AGMQNFLRTMAVAISTSVILTVWGDSTRVARSEIVSKLQPDDAMRMLGNSGMGLEQARQTISNIVDQEAVAVALDHSFVLSALVLFIAAAVVWLTPKAKGPVDTSAAH